MCSTMTSSRQSIRGETMYHKITELQNIVRNLQKERNQNMVLVMVLY